MPEKLANQSTKEWTSCNLLENQSCACMVCMAQFSMLVSL